MKTYEVLLESQRQYIKTLMESNKQLLKAIENHKKTCEHIEREYLLNLWPCDFELWSVLGDIVGDVSKNTDVSKDTEVDPNETRG